VQDRGLTPRSTSLIVPSFTVNTHRLIPILNCRASWFGPTARSRSVWTQCCVHSWRCRVYFRSLTGPRFKSSFCANKSHFLHLARVVRLGGCWPMSPRSLTAFCV
jgi:hypothetical protein